MEPVIEIEANILRAAMHCMARNDIRHHLNGILLDIDGSVVSTNGHIMFYSKTFCEPTKRKMIIKIEGIIPRKAEKAQLIMVDDEYGLMKLKFKKNKYGVSHEKLLGFKILEGKFPDYKKYTDSISELKEVKRFGVSTRYLETLNKIFGGSNHFGSIIFNFFGDGENMIITEYSCDSGLPHHTKIILMPMRL